MLLAKPITLVATAGVLLLGIAVYYTLKRWVWGVGGKFTHNPHHNLHHKTRGILTTTRLSLRGLIVLAAHEQPLPQRDCQGVELNARLRN